MRYCNPIIVLMVKGIRLNNLIEDSGKYEKEIPIIYNNDFRFP